jgi:hypothetical protein
MVNIIAIIARLVCLGRRTGESTYRMVAAKSHSLPTSVSFPLINLNVSNFIHEGDVKVRRMDTLSCGIPFSRDRAPILGVRTYVGGLENRFNYLQHHSRWRAAIFLVMNGQSRNQRSRTLLGCSSRR